MTSCCRYCPFLNDWLIDKLLKILSLSLIINNMCVNILLFLYSWTDNTPRIPKMYNFICIWWIHPKLLTVKPITTLCEVKWNESTTIIFVYLFYTKSITKYKSFYWQFWVMWLIITLNYQQFPGKQQHNNVWLSALYKNITKNRRFHWHSGVMVLNYP